MDIKENLNKFFNKKELSSHHLLKLVEQVMDELPAEVLKEDSLGFDEGDSISDLLPTVKITESWGSPGSKDRQIIEEFTNKIKGETVEAKIQSLNSILSGEAQDPSLGEILATLLMIEVLNSILDEFTEAAGGFIFEGFLAGLFGDKSVQITDVKGEESDAKGKPITDVVLGNKEYSLKLLGPGTDVKGSFRNMIEHFKVKDHVIYLDARSTG